MVLEGETGSGKTTQLPKILLDMGYGELKPARWHEGAPQTGWTGNVKVNKKELKPLRAFRCERCHLVEFYAD